MNKLIIASLGISFALAGCSNSTANKSNFTEAINAKLKETGINCISTALVPYKKSAEEALENVGLYKDGKLTDQAKKYAKDESNLCWSASTVDDVISWTEPSDYAGFTMSHVSYTYKVGAVAKWAEDAAVQENFPQIARTIAGEKNAAKPKKMTLVLTNEGWSADH